MRQSNPEAFVSYTNLRNSVLRDQETPAWFKELLLGATLKEPLRKVRPKNNCPNVF